MELSRLQPLVEQHLTQREIAKKVGLSLTATQYWLRKHGLKTHYGPKGIPRDPTIPRKCIRCGETDHTEFYGRRWNLCKRCDNSRTNERSKANRDFALSLLGRKCVKCLFDVPVALDVHHTDHTIKDVAFRHMRTWSRARIEKELKTCVLLCKNCHAITHSQLHSKFIPKTAA